MSEQTHNYQHQYRFINAAILLLTCLFNSLIVQSLSTINHEVTTYFPQISTPEVSLCALVFMLIHPFNTFLANYILDSYSLKLGITINCVIVIVGMLLRTLISVSFVWVILGNGVVALGNIFVLCVPAKFAAVWFLPSSRVLVTSVLLFVNSISGAVGSIFSPVFVRPDLQPSQGQSEIISYIQIQTGAVCACMLLNILLFRGDPASTSCTKKKLPNSSSPTYRTTLKQLFTTKDYIFLLLMMIFTMSIMNSFATNVELYMIPFDRSSKDASLLLGVSTLAGLGGAFMSSQILKRYQRYKKTIGCLYVLAMVGIVVFWLGLSWDVDVLFWGAVGVFGFSVYPILPGIIQYGCERMYPVGEATVMGVLLAGGELGSFLNGLIQSVILEGKTKQGVLYSLIVYVVILGVSLLLFFHTEEQLNRIRPRDSLLTHNQSNDTQA